MGKRTITYAVNLQITGNDTHIRRSITSYARSEEMTSFLILILSFFLVACVSNGLFAAEPPLREIIVSHADENNILQLYHIKDDGSSRRKITNAKHGCMMPAVSPDGSKIVYVQQSRKRMALWLSDLNGKNSKALTESGRNLIPSWLPDSKHIVWMLSEPGKSPSVNSQLRMQVIYNPMLPGDTSKSKQAQCVQY